MLAPREKQPKPEKFVCGAITYFDTESGCSYRCSSCFATIGSMGMPGRCAELQEKVQQQTETEKEQGNYE